MYCSLCIICMIQINFLSCLRLLLSIDHFSFVCLVAWHLNESEAGVHLVLIRNLTAFLM